MPTKYCTFNLSGGEIEIPVEWSYWHQEAKLDALPENCRPEMEESEVDLPKNLGDLLCDWFRTQMMPTWLDELESQRDKLRDDCREWAREEE